MRIEYVLIYTSGIEIEERSADAPTVKTVEEVRWEESPVSHMRRVPIKFPIRKRSWEVSASESATEKTPLYRSFTCRVRVKLCGKSTHWIRVIGLKGKPHPEQDQDGERGKGIPFPELPHVFLSLRVDRSDKCSSKTETGLFLNPTNFAVFIFAISWVITLYPLVSMGL